NRHARRDRAGAVRQHARPMVALHQLVSRDVGTERLPPCVSTVRDVRHPLTLRARRRRHERHVMTRGRLLLLAAGLLACAVSGRIVRTQDSAGGPIIVVDTTKGTFVIETYPNEAPKTVAHVVELAKGGFYDGQRF